MVEKAKPRARKDEEKLQRRQDILDVAWQLFQETSYQAITMSEVAQRSGLAKGTVYLYFKTKEELFLGVQEQQFEAWFNEIDERLDELSDPDNRLEQVARVLCKSLEKRANLTRLLTILHSILEQNIDFDSALRLKRMLLVRISGTGARLEQHLPFLQPGEGGKVLLRIYALIIGLHEQADPSPVARQAMEHDPALRVMLLDFKQEFAETVLILLKGMKYLKEKENAND